MQATTLPHQNSCPWWARWYHQRQRYMDIEATWPSLVARASNIAEARVAWEVFLSLEGQTHWRCPCGILIAELFRTVTLTVEE